MNSSLLNITLNSTLIPIGDHKYNYNGFEQLLMVIITAITNFSFTPCLIILIKRKNYFPSFLGFFTMVTSFTYHFMESLAIVKIFNMDEFQWHKLDNIGAICCFISLAVYLMDNRNAELDTILNFSALIVVIILQESSPWEILFTVIPILTFVILIFVISYFRNRLPSYKNKKMFNTGFKWMLVGFVCFYFGLDEYKDYLRFFHGCWHFVVGVSSFFVWQSKTRIGDEFTLSNLFSKKLHPSSLDVKFATDWD